MSIRVDPSWLIALLLGSIRAGAWLIVVPPFSSRRVVPPMVLVAIAVGLGILSAPHLSASGVPTTTAGLIGAIGVQVFTGVALGLTVQILISAVSAAGSYVDLFGGLNLPPSEDPLSQNQMPLMGQFYEQLAMVLLFVSNGELLLIRGFETSFLGPGLTLSASSRLANVVTADLATFFTASLEIAAPIIAVLFATQIGLALLSKAAPQMNVWVLGFPIQALLSLAFVAIGVRVLPGFLDNIVGRILQDGTALVGGH